MAVDWWLRNHKTPNHCSMPNHCATVINPISVTEGDRKLSSPLPRSFLPPHFFVAAKGHHHRLADESLVEHSFVKDLEPQRNCNLPMLQMCARLMLLMPFLLLTIKSLLSSFNSTCYFKFQWLYFVCRRETLRDRRIWRKQQHRCFLRWVFVRSPRESGHLHPPLVFKPFFLKGHNSLWIWAP